MNPIRTTSYTSGTRFLRTLPPDHHRAFANRVPEAVTVEIAEAGHYPHETDSTKLLEPMQIFLASTVPFQYSATSWVDRLTHLSQPTAAGPDRRGTVNATQPSASTTSGG
jgi:hypothetical protein